MIMLNIYRPEVHYAPVYFPRNGTPPYLRYNHCVDVIRFRDRFLAVWNANTVGNEGVSGQYDFISYSNDYRHWTAPEKLFAGKRCSPPVFSDRQWQPSFLKCSEELLFCAWCDTASRKTYVASTGDGEHWSNREISGEEIPAETVAFPTNHGLKSSDGSLYFPVSFATKDIGLCCFAGALISRDEGKSWHWSTPVEAQEWSCFHIVPEKFPLERPALWEPMIYEARPGVLGMLIRNNTSTSENPSIQAEHLLLYSESCDRGESWSPARPVEVETIVSRCFAQRVDSALLMVMNDWIRGIPDHIAKDRFHLTLYWGPNGDPDLLLPGPEVQPGGGCAFYPNGFVYQGKLYLGYTYPDYIEAAVVEELPDLTQPFLLPRQSRGWVEFSEDGMILERPQATVGLVPTAEMADAACLALSFRVSTEVRNENDFPILTLGGKSRNGVLLLLQFDPQTDKDRLILQPTEGDEACLGELGLGASVRIDVRLHKDRICFEVRDEKVELPCRILRKMAFGGLYEPPVYPPESVPVRDRVLISEMELSRTL